MMSVCDSLRFLQASMDASGSDNVNAQAVVTGARKLGSYDCLTAFACEMSSDRPDGASAVRMITYDPAQSAFVYQGADLETAP